jgi:diadenylate cyclase
MMDFLPAFLSEIRWQDIVDFFIIYYVFYRALLLIRGTRAMQMLTGFGIVIIVFLLSKNLGLYTVYVMLKELLSPLVIIIIIIFQDDIRRGLIHFGKNPFLPNIRKLEESHVVEEVLKAAYSMAEKRVGAIIVIERDTGLRSYVEEGFRLEAKVTSELLISIFLPYGPMHDGAVVIKGGQIMAAGCFLPSSSIMNLPKNYGARHRAALGLSEQTDALIVVVSEETSDVSLVVDTKIQKGLDQKSLSQKMLRLLENEKKV